LTGRKEKVILKGREGEIEAFEVIGLKGGYCQKFYEKVVNEI